MKDGRPCARVGTFGSGFVERDGEHSEGIAGGSSTLLLLVGTDLTKRNNSREPLRPRMESKESENFIRGMIHEVREFNFRKICRKFLSGVE